MAYHISSGEVSTGITLKNDYMHISSGGVANSTTVNSGGSMFISSGGVANSTVLSGYSATMYISSGGVASNTTVNAYGYMCISSGGVANSTTVNSRGSMFISRGGNANSITLLQGGQLGGFSFNEDKYIDKVVDGSAVIFPNVTIIGNIMRISSGGVANSTTVNSGGWMWISSGGTANSTTVNQYCSMSISSGGVAYNTTIKGMNYNGRGAMYISSGGVANRTAVESGGVMFISSGGMATDIVANSGAWLYIAVAPDTYIQGTYAGSAFEMKDAQISGYTVVKGGTILISSGGVASNTTVNSGGFMRISSGGVANSTTVNDDGEMSIRGVHRGSLSIAYGAIVSAYEGGVIDFTVSDRKVDDGYLINNLSLISGTPTYTITVSADQAFGTYKLAQGAENFTGTISIGDGTTNYGTITVNGEALTYNNLKYTLTQSNGNLLLDVATAVTPKVFIYSSGTLTSSGAEITGALLSSGGNNSMHVSSGGVANSTTVNYGGSMYISSGGVANSTTVNHGKMLIYSGGVANSTTVNCDGANNTNVFMYIYSGGVANSTTVNGGRMHIYSGGVANSTTVNSGGNIYIYSGGVANSTTVNGGVLMRIYSGGVANSTTVNRCYMHIFSDGVANSTTVNSGGKMHLLGGGVANSTTVNSLGSMYINSGGVANSTTVNSLGFMHISSGGTATDITAQAGAYLVITVASDTYIQGMYNGSAFEMKDAFIAGYTVHSGGWMDISSGGVANITTVNSGSMYIYSDGVANNTTVNSDGWMNIFSGGVANSTTVNSGGSMYISSGGVHRGKLTIADGAIVSADEGSIIDFTVEERTVADDYLINDLSLITGTPTYTITVSADQAFGTYKLAQGASAFTGTLSIGDGITSYGNITVNGENLTNNNIIFALNEYNGNLTLSVMQKGFTDIAEKMIFINSRYTEKVTGKKQSGVELAYGENAFISIADALKKYPDLRRKTLITVENKVEGGIYYNAGVVAGTAVLPVIKATDNSYSYKANSTPRAVLTISRDTGSTEFIRFATVNLYGAKVNSITGGKLISNISKSSVDKKGTVTNTEKSTLTGNVAGKFTAINGSAGVVENYATVTLTGAEVATLSGGNTKETSNSKLVDSSSKDQKVISTVNNNIAAGSVTLKAGAKVDNIEQYKTVTLTDSVAGDITNFTSKDSKSDTFTFDEAKKTVTRKVALTHTESTAGTFKATDSTVGDVTGFATVNLKNVTSSGDFRRVAANGKAYSKVKESLNIKTDKKGVVTGSYTKTETFTRAGKFTAAGSTVGDIENFSNVTLDGSKAEDISNFVEAKIVTTGTAIWDNAEAYGRPEDYAIDLQGWNMEEPIVTKSLNGAVTLKNGASAESITNFKSVTMTASKVDDAITNVNKVTVKKGDSTIDSYTGTDDNDTVTIAKGAVLTANKIDLGAGAKDKLAINGTLILTGSEAALPFVNASNITGKGEIAVVEELFDKVTVDFANLLNVGETADNFRGTAYENADDTAKKAVKWDGKGEYNGWLGAWEGYKEGSDTVDYIKFKAVENAQLTVSGDVDWTLLDKKGNDIGKEITAAGEYTIKLNHEEGSSISYQIKLA